MQISRDYGVLLEDEGIALRGLFIIDPKGVLRYTCALTNLFSLTDFDLEDKLLSMTSPSDVRSMRPFV